MPETVPGKPHAMAEQRQGFLRYQRVDAGQSRFRGANGNSATSHAHSKRSLKMLSLVRKLRALLLTLAFLLAGFPAFAAGLTIGQPVRYEGIVCSKAGDAKALLDHVVAKGERSYFKRPELCLTGEISFTPKAILFKAQASDTGATWQVVQVHLVNINATGYIITSLPLYSGQLI
jgi:hypothetical protein